MAASASYWADTFSKFIVSLPSCAPFTTFLQLHRTETIGLICNPTPLIHEEDPGIVRLRSQFMQDNLDQIADQFLRRMVQPCERGRACGFSRQLERLLGGTDDIRYLAHRSQQRFRSPAGEPGLESLNTS
ncbi:hypothetical protein J7T55_004357 [Diaporthe amygdali]|uniref:uncharacterized protein n=1 Tax=Phomopsis amygdali TaxID=1214568 RepID=UPI0022FEB431|nr:uncharacterized protein J7T55_004357 [Diaporthe amygdali]KAJ0109807.1 hypothetical protein J7T55_004357 [Diaporthe amygdali]